MDKSQEKLLSIGVVILLSVAGLATIIYYNDDSPDSDTNGENVALDLYVDDFDQDQYNFRNSPLQLWDLSKRKYPILYRYRYLHYSMQLQQSQILPKGL